ncbi:MAG: SprT family zinc-dependent metalloprotease [Betaproteobacteria bacterium]
MPWQAELPLVAEKPLAENETSRTIALGDRIVPYVLRRAKRRTIGLSIDHRGLRVGAPPRAALSEVEALILQHAAWVAQKLDDWRSRRRPEPLTIIDGMTLPMLGESLEIRLALGANRVLWNEQAAPVVTLFLRTPADAGRILEKALRERARQLFAERLAHFAAKMHLDLPALTLSDARTRWGSCSRRSGIRLNWRLIHFQRQVVDYVVIHELAHLHEMNHSPHFWAVVERFCPDYRQQREDLKTLAAQCPQWRQK